MSMILGRKTEQENVHEEYHGHVSKLGVRALHHSSNGPRIVRIRGTAKPNDPAFLSRPRVANSMEGRLHVQRGLRSNVEKSLESRSRFVPESWIVSQKPTRPDSNLIEKSLASDSLLVYLHQSSKRKDERFSSRDFTSGRRPVSREDVQHELNRSRLRSAQAARMALQRASSFSDDSTDGKDDGILSTSPINPSKSLGEVDVFTHCGDSNVPYDSDEDYEISSFESDSVKVEETDVPEWHIFDAYTPDGISNAFKTNRFRVHTPTKMERSQLLFRSVGNDDPCNNLNSEESSDGSDCDGDEAQFLLASRDAYDPVIFSPSRKALGGYGVADSIRKSIASPPQIKRMDDTTL